MKRRFQLFYLVRDKSREFSVTFDANGFGEAQLFFTEHFDGLELTRIVELTR